MKSGAKKQKHYTTNLSIMFKGFFFTFNLRIISVVLHFNRMLASNYLSPSLYSVFILRSDVNIRSPLVSKMSDYWFRSWIYLFLNLAETSCLQAVTKEITPNDSAPLQVCAAFISL